MAKKPKAIRLSDLIDTKPIKPARVTRKEKRRFARAVEMEMKRRWGEEKPSLPINRGIFIRA